MRCVKCIAAQRVKRCPGANSGLPSLGTFLASKASSKGGVDAAQAIFGEYFRVGWQRGQLIESALAPRAAATVHPSSILRAPRLFVADLKKIAQAL